MYGTHSCYLASIRPVQLRVGAHGRQRARVEALREHGEVRLEPVEAGDARLPAVPRPVEVGEVLAPGVDQRVPAQRVRACACA